MMNTIFGFMVVFGAIAGAVTGRMPQLSNAVLSSSGGAVELTLSLMGSFCLWGGVMRVAEESGLTEMLARAAEPVTKRLFRGLNAGGGAMQAITMNITANLLGLGNAATPLGIAAMRAMAAEERATDTATDNMALFVAMNTASLQLIPATTATLRMAAGSKAPLDILPAVWCASAVSVAVGITVAKLFASGSRRY